MKQSILLLSLFTISALADKVYYKTIRVDNVVCSVDIHVRDSGVIKTFTHCFTK